MAILKKNEKRLLANLLDDGVILTPTVRLQYGNSLFFKFIYFLRGGGERERERKKERIPGSLHADARFKLLNHEITT